MNNKFFCLIIIVLISIITWVYPIFSTERIDSDLTSQLQQYLTQLVSFKTISADQKTNKEAMDWVEAQLKTLPLNFTHTESNGFPSLIITHEKTKTPKLWLIAHMDVVYGKESLFHPFIEENKMFGRGVCDMKMAIACYLLLIEEMKNELDNYDFGIILTSDEEVNGANGIKYLLEEGYSSQVVLLPDGGFDWKLEESAKGIMEIKVIATGKAAHGSRPWLGNNAISNLMPVLQQIDTSFVKEKTLHVNYFPTANLGFIKGGKSINQVPDYAEAHLDVRYPPFINPEDIYTKLLAISKNHPGISIEKIQESLPHKVDPNGQYLGKFRKIAKKMYDIDVGSTLSHGSSDAWYFGQKGIPVLVVAPKGGEIHSDDEWIDVEDLTRFYHVMKAWVKEVSQK